MLRDDEIWFRFDDDVGHVVGVDLDAVRDPSQFLSAPEHAVAADFVPRRFRTFAGGRCALRQALTDIGATVPAALLWNERGAIVVPAPLLCSVSHKDEVAVACVAERERGFVGIDIERTTRERPTDVRRHVLTPDECERLGAVEGVSPESEVLLRFSLKEALYKVLDPSLRRYVGFHEVEVQPRRTGATGGDAQCHYMLKAGAPPLTSVLRWHEVVRRKPRPEAFFISTARATFAVWPPAPQPETAAT